MRLSVPLPCDSAIKWLTVKGDLTFHVPFLQLHSVLRLDISLSIAVASQSSRYIVVSIPVPEPITEKQLKMPNKRRRLQTIITVFFLSLFAVLAVPSQLPILLTLITPMSNVTWWLTWGEKNLVHRQSKKGFFCD